MIYSNKAQAIEPNPPRWDTDHVKILSPDDPEKNQQIVDDIYKEMGGFTND